MVPFFETLQEAEGEATRGQEDRRSPCNWDLYQSGLLQMRRHQHTAISLVGRLFVLSLLSKKKYGPVQRAAKATVGFRHDLTE